MESGDLADPEKVKEYFCDKTVLHDQADCLAKWVKQAKHVVFFTGAGVSTSAGIPDFRGPQGVRTLHAQGKAPKYGTSTSKAIPTPTHMALVALQNVGKLSLLISQNCDGLHRRSGMDPKNLAELHGNSNLEICKKCKREYLRDFCCRANNIGVHEHRTGRQCMCGGPLYDSIINFGESLPTKALTSANDHSKRADLFVVLGSSLTVSPANDMPVTAKNQGAKLVVCNLQKTHLDQMADMRVFAKTDDLMVELLGRLKIKIPSFVLTRRVEISVRKVTNKCTVTVNGVESDGTPASIFSSVELSMGAQQYRKTGEPYRAEFIELHRQSSAVELEVVLNFMGHYNEPAYALKLPISPGDHDAVHKFILTYDPPSYYWSCKQI